MEYTYKASKQGKSWKYEALKNIYVNSVDELALEIKTTPIWGNAWMMEPPNFETKQMGVPQLKEMAFMPIKLIGFLPLI